MNGKVVVCVITKLLDIIIAVFKPTRSLTAVGLEIQLTGRRCLRVVKVPMITALRIAI